MKKYKEQLKTCIFFARATYYPMTSSCDDNFRFRLFDKVIELDKKYPLIMPNNSSKPWKKINKLSEFLMTKVPSISWIYKLPFINTMWSTNPIRYYQKWCEELKDYFTIEEIKKINNDEIQKGGRDFIGNAIWNLMQEQHKYIPIISEIKWIYNHHKYGQFFVEKA